MPQPNANDRGYSVDLASVANDDHQPPAKTVTLAELASATQMDEDTLLLRLVAILRKREKRAKTDAAEE